MKYTYEALGRATKQAYPGEFDDRTDAEVGQATEKAYPGEFEIDHGTMLGRVVSDVQTGLGELPAAGKALLSSAGESLQKKGRILATASRFSGENPALVAGLGKVASAAGKGLSGLSEGIEAPEPKSNTGKFIRGAAGGVGGIVGSPEMIPAAATGPYAPAVVGGLSGSEEILAHVDNIMGAKGAAAVRKAYKEGGIEAAKSTALGAIYGFLGGQKLPIQQIGGAISGWVWAAIEKHPERAAEYMGQDMGTPAALHLGAAAMRLAAAAPKRVAETPPARPTAQEPIDVETTPIPRETAQRVLPGSQARPLLNEPGPSGRKIITPAPPGEPSLRRIITPDVNAPERGPYTPPNAAAAETPMERGNLLGGPGYPKLIGQGQKEVPQYTPEQLDKALDTYRAALKATKSTKVKAQIQDVLAQLTALKADQPKSYGGERGAVSVELLTSPLRALGAVGKSLVTGKPIEATAKPLSELSAKLGLKSGRFETLKSDPRGMKLLSAFQEADQPEGYERWSSVMDKNTLASILPDEGARGLFGKYLADQMSRAVDAKNAAEGVTKPNNLPKLTDPERSAIAKDPGIQRAIEWWKQDLMPRIEKISGPAGVESRLYGPDEIYAAMSRIVEGEPAPAEGRVASLISRMTKKRSVSARPATGSGEAYSTDPNVMIDKMWTRWRAAAGNNLIEAMKGMDVGPEAKEVQFGGKTVPVTSVTLLPEHMFQRGEGGEVRHGYEAKVVRVPKPAADAYEHFVSTKRKGGDTNAWEDFWTGLYTAGPTESIIHNLSVRGTAVNRISGGAASLHFLTEQLKASKASTAMRGTEDYNRVSEYLSRNGALRSSIRIDTPTAKAIHGTLKAGENIPVAGKAIKVINDISENRREHTFGNEEKGIPGSENDMRVWAALGLEKANPKLSEAEIASIVRSNFGERSRAFMGKLQSIQRHVDPFAGAFYGLGKSGVKATLGFTMDNQFSPRLLARNLGTMAATWYAWNKAMDPEHKDKPRVPFGYFEVVPGAKHPVALPLFIFNSAMARGLSNTTLGAAVNEKWRDPKASGDEVAAAMLRQLANVAMRRSLGTPITSGAFELLTGRLPQMSAKKDFPPIPGVTPSMSHPVRNRLPAVLYRRIPLAEKFAESEDEKPSDYGAPVDIPRAALKAITGTTAYVGTTREEQKNISERAPFGEANALVDEEISTLRHRYGTDNAKVFSELNKFIASDNIDEEQKDAARRYALRKIFGERTVRQMHRRARF